MTVRCPSNGLSASSTSGLLAPAAQSSAGRATCSCLPWPAVLPRRPHRPHTTPTTGQAIPPLTHTPYYSAATVASDRSEPVNPRTVALPSAWKTTAESSLPPCRSLPRPLRRPPPCALGAAWSTWSSKDIHQKWTVRGEADSWVHGRTQGNASLLRAK